MAPADFSFNKSWRVLSFQQVNTMIDIRSFKCVPDYTIEPTKLTILVAIELAVYLYHYDQHERILTPIHYQTASPDVDAWVRTFIEEQHSGQTSHIITHYGYQVFYREFENIKQVLSTFNSANRPEFA